MGVGGCNSCIHIGFGSGRFISYMDGSVANFVSLGT